MPVRCGDPAEFRYKVKAASVGDAATTTVRREKDGNLTAFSSETLQKAEDKKIKWPDLQNPKSSEFFGGRQADFKGLNKKSYQDKFKIQTFALSLQVSGKSAKSSKGLKINGYPDVGRDHKQIGLPMATEVWETNNVGVRVIKSSDPTGNAYKTLNCGNFHLEVKDGVVHITIKLSLHSKRKLWSKALVFRTIKKTVERYWNGSSGFKQWTWHRADCKRGNDCHCKLVLDAKGSYTQAGCCKVPVRVNLEQGADNPVEIQFLSRAQKRELKKNGFVAGLTADTGHLWYPEDVRNTFAHEIGHMMGFPDQYWSGVTAAGAVVAGLPVPGAAWPVDDDSIMGQNMNSAKEIHFKATWFAQWVAAKVDNLKVLNR
jgi:hypothetical protein